MPIMIINDNILLLVTKPKKIPVLLVAEAKKNKDGEGENVSFHIMNVM